MQEVTCQHVKLTVRCTSSPGDDATTNSVGYVHGPWIAWPHRERSRPGRLLRAPKGLPRAQSLPPHRQPGTGGRKIRACCAGQRHQTRPPRIAPAPGGTQQRTPQSRQGVRQCSCVLEPAGAPVQYSCASRRVPSPAETWATCRTVFCCTSRVSFSTACATGMAPRSPSMRSRTLTVPCSISRPPTINM